MQQLAMGLDSINQLAASSPFKALATLESTKEAINDKNHIWDFWIKSIYKMAMNPNS